MDVLLDYCNTEFPARRKLEGGYQYCPNGITRGCINVSGSKLSKSDWIKIKNAKPWEMNWENVFDQFDNQK